MERIRKLKTVLLRRGAFSIGFGYIISIFLGNLGAEVFLESWLGFLGSFADFFTYRALHQCMIHGGSHTY